MLQSFIYAALPTRIVFGRGKISGVADEAKRLGMKRPLVITGKHQAGAGNALAGLPGVVGGSGATAAGGRDEAFRISMPSCSLLSTM